MKKLLAASILICLHILTFSQTSRIDSLQKRIASSPADTQQVNEINLLCEYYWRAGKYPEALTEANRAQSKARYLSFTPGEATSHQNIATIYWFQGNLAGALQHYSSFLTMAQKAGNKKMIAKGHQGVGLVYKSMGNYPEALKRFFDALTLYEALQNKNGIANMYTNLGNVYDNLGNFQEAFAYNSKALAMFEEMKDEWSSSAAYNNLGNVLSKQGKLAEAYTYYKRSLELRQKNGNKPGLSTCYNNLGDLCELQGNYLEALTYYTNCFVIREALGDMDGLASSAIGLARVNIKLGKKKGAAAYLDKALKISKEIGARDITRDVYYVQVQLDSAEQNDERGLKDFKLFILYKDSLANEENTKKAVQAEMQYGFDKKEGEARAEQDRKDAVAEAEKRKQEIILLSISGFGLLVFGFAIFAYRSFLQKKKTNIEITAQKHLIEEKQKEILDSIYYARRIQRSLMTNERYISKVLERLTG